MAFGKVASITLALAQTTMPHWGDLAASLNGACEQLFKSDLNYRFSIDMAFLKSNLPSGGMDADGRRRSRFKGLDKTGHHGQNEAGSVMAFDPGWQTASCVATSQQ